MHKIIVLFAFIVSTAAHANEQKDPTPAQCLKAFARDYVPEYNSKNDYILSTDQKDVAGALDVIKSFGFAKWLVDFSAANLNEYTTAVGAVFNYGDEIHIIYTSINIEGGKCQVKELADLNTVDIEESSDKSLLAKYFLGVPKSKLPGIAKEYLYDDVKNKLAGTEE